MTESIPLLSRSTLHSTLHVQHCMYITQCMNAGGLDSNVCNMTEAPSAEASVWMQIRLVESCSGIASWCSAFAGVCPLQGT